MPRARAPSGASTTSSHSLSEHDPQELGSMYDYLAKIILLGPSGCGKSCLLHRFVRGEWKILSSQTIGVEFSSKIIKVGTGSRRKRIKLQLWDTAGQERFRSVTRSYYRGAAGALLIYDITRRATFTSLPTFLSDARALASPDLTVLLVGNKADLSTPTNSPPATPTGTSSTTPLPLYSANPNAINVTRTRSGTETPGSSATSTHSSSYVDSSSASFSSDATISNPWRNFHSTNTRSSTFNISPDTNRLDSHGGIGGGGGGPHGPEISREVPYDDAARFASASGIPVAMETSAMTGENVDEVFERLARVILTRIELGEIDPDDPNSGVSYGDGGGWSVSGGASTSAIGNTSAGKKKKGTAASLRLGSGGRKGVSGLGVGREWEEVFGVDGGGGAVARRKRCC